MKTNYFKNVIENTLNKYCTTERIDDNIVGVVELEKRLKNLEDDINGLIVKFNTENDLTLYRHGKEISEVSLYRRPDGRIDIRLL